MTHQRAKAALDGTRFSDLRWVPETGSTNVDLVAAARSGAGECALVADLQTAGRGRLDRSFQAPPGASLLLSVLVRPPFPVAGVHLLGTALGVAAVEAVRSLAGVDVALKWPNDIVAPGVGAGGSDLKLGGLLAEYVTGDGGDAVVLGLGLNLAWADVGFPSELVSTATAVDMLGGRIERAELVVELLRYLDLTGELATRAVACDLLAESYRERCVTIGRRVRVELPAGQIVGEARDVGLDGSLVVVGDDGVTHHVTVGDVIHLRPVQ